MQSETHFRYCVSCYEHIDSNYRIAGRKLSYDGGEIVGGGGKYLRQKAIMKNCGACPKKNLPAAKNTRVWLGGREDRAVMG